MRIIPVILSGGSGARLWALSRKEHPKQYLQQYKFNRYLMHKYSKENFLNQWFLVRRKL